jgi:hypothetical protein
VTESADSLVASYLARIEHASMDLPAHLRGELLRDLREHIQSAREELEPGTAVQIHAMLDRLGEPEAIVAAAQVDNGPPTLKTLATDEDSVHRRLRPALIVAAFIVLAIIAILILGFLTNRSSDTTGGASAPFGVSAGLGGQTNAPNG